MTAEYTYNLIKSLGVCDSILNKDKSAYKYFMNLFETQYTPDEETPDKLAGIIDFKIIRQKLTQVLFERGEIPADEVKLELGIIKSDGTEDSISWLSCFDGPMTKRQKLISAFIVSIHNHPKHLVKGRTEFRFVDEFLKKNSIIPTTFDKNEFNQWIFKKEDNTFRKKWVKYYNKHNPYICKTCHPTFTDAEGWIFV